MLRRLILVSVAICITEPVVTQRVRDAECRVACRHSGYDSGRFVTDHCVCMDDKDYDAMMSHKKLVLPSRPRVVKPDLW